MLQHICFLFKFLEGHGFEKLMELLRQNIQAKQARATAASAESTESKACENSAAEENIVDNNALLEVYFHSPHLVWVILMCVARRPQRARLPSRKHFGRVDVK